MLFLAGLDGWAQSTSEVKVDPGISVHNYKHPNKAMQAKKMQPTKVRRSSSRVGIVPRSSRGSMPRTYHQTPKYARRTGWTFFRRSNPRPTVLNPLTNPNHYKVNQER
jgi:hypothetical protein